MAGNAQSTVTKASQDACFSQYQESLQCKLDIFTGPSVLGARCINLARTSQASIAMGMTRPNVESSLMLIRRAATNRSVAYMACIQCLPQCLCQISSLGPGSAGANIKIVLMQEEQFAKERAEVLRNDVAVGWIFKWLDNVSELFSPKK
jgi:hypothetical protein